LDFRSLKIFLIPFFLLFYVIFTHKKASENKKSQYKWLALSERYIYFSNELYLIERRVRTEDVRRDQICTVLPESGSEHDVQF
jgi:hypothetical protein